MSKKIIEQKMKDFEGEIGKAQENIDSLYLEKELIMSEVERLKGLKEIYAADGELDQFKKAGKELEDVEKKLEELTQSEAILRNKIVNIKKSVEPDLLPLLKDVNAKYNAECKEMSERAIESYKAFLEAFKAIQEHGNEFDKYIMSLGIVDTAPKLSIRPLLNDVSYFVRNNPIKY